MANHYRTRLVVEVATADEATQTCLGYPLVANNNLEDFRVYAASGTTEYNHFVKVVDVDPTPGGTD